MCCFTVWADGKFTNQGRCIRDQPGQQNMVIVELRFVVLVEGTFKGTHLALHSLNGSLNFAIRL